MSHHPINNLSSEGLDLLNDRLTEIAVALDDNRTHNMERIERILPLDLFNELRAYLGTIREAQHTICELLYGDVELLISEGLGRLTPFENHNPSVAAYAAAIADAMDRIEADQCSPHGIERPIVPGGAHAICPEGTVG